MLSSNPVIVTLFLHQETLAQKLAKAAGGHIHKRPDDFEHVENHLQSQFLAGHPLVFIGSLGILVRAIGPLLTSKWQDPPVLCVDESAQHVIPVTGGHHGANQLAIKLAEAIGAQAVITTAGDATLGVALDEPPKGWILANPFDAKNMTAALLQGQAVTITGKAGWLEPLSKRSNVTMTKSSSSETRLVIEAEGKEPLIYYQQTLALGVGAVRGCSSDVLLAFVLKGLADHGISQYEIEGVYSIDLKSDERAVTDLARHLGVEARFFPAQRLEEETGGVPNPSKIVFDEVGCHSVSEASALARGGSGSTLVVEKNRCVDATFALAKICEDGDLGQKRGICAVIGIGPGAAEMQTQEVKQALAQCDEIVGYSLYLDLLGAQIKGKSKKIFNLGQEEERCRYALEQAAKGLHVGLISSGDAGIYAMASLVIELVERKTNSVSAAAKRAELVFLPGITAMQAASAKAGALLGHDFCAISLSDLLTPKDVIIRRLKAAALGDFVIAFYNPVSKKRRELFETAKSILLEHRDHNTPVVLARHLGRPSENLELTSLGEVSTDQIDMMTIVMIGSSQTKTHHSGDKGAAVSGHFVFTPRGYFS